MKTLLTALVTAALLVTTASSALADDRIGLSRDGVSWSDQLTEPLFDPDVLWVPGDVRTASFFVRNESPELAELSVDFLGTEVDGLIETGDLTVMASGGGAGWSASDASGTHRLVSDVGVSSAEGARVDVTVAFDADSVNVSQTLAFDLDLRVNVQEAVDGSLSNGDSDSDGDADAAGDGDADAAGDGDSDSDADGGGAGDLQADTDEQRPGAGGLLPDTGGFGFWILVAGLSLLVMGIAVTSTRRQEEDTHV